MNGHRRLVLALLISLALHAAIITIIAWAGVRGSLSVRQVAPPAPPALSVSVRALPARQPANADAPSAHVPPGGSPRPAPADATLDSVARLLAPPDFSEVELLPIPGGVELRYRIAVSPSGAVAKVTLVRSGLVPESILPVVERALRAARYTPARSNGKPVAGTVEIAVDIQPVGSEIPRFETPAR